ncbi:MAG: ABC transporter ATP-binding protein [Acidobacteriota bacterium]
MMSDLLRVRNVTKVYSGEGASVTALKGVSFAVKSGEFVAVMGPSGCGKSTLLHLMGGMDRPTEGRIWLGDLPLHRLSEEELTRLRRTRIGFVFQFFYLLPTLTVEENVELPFLLAGGKDRRQKVRSLLEAVRLTHRARAHPSQLSGGEMQRAAIARALVQDPLVILADEPTGNLDSENGRVVIELLRKLAAQRGATVVMATHSLEAARFASRRIQMKDGCLLA